MRHARCTEGIYYLLERQSFGQRRRPLHVLLKQIQNALVQLVEMADGAPKLRFARFEPRRHFRKRRRGGGAPCTLAGGEALLHQPSLIGAGLKAERRGCTPEADESIPMLFDLGFHRRTIHRACSGQAR